MTRSVGKTNEIMRNILYTLITLILFSCQNNMEEASDSLNWELGCMWSENVDTTLYRPGIYELYQDLEVDGAGVDDLIKRFGPPYTISASILYSKDFETDKDKMWIYKYIRPELADSLLKKDYTIVTTVIWCLKDSSDLRTNNEKYRIVKFIGYRDDRRAVWGYTGNFRMVFGLE